MQTSNEHGMPNNSIPCKHRALRAGNARNASKTSPAVTPAQAEFLEFFSKTEMPGISSSLRLAHELVLYHTDVPLDDEEKLALHNLKMLWEEIDKMVEAD